MKERDQQLLPKDQDSNVGFAAKYPNVFRWRVASLVIIILIAITAVCDILLYVHLQENQDTQYNLTFINDIIMKTEISNITGENFGFLMNNMLQLNDHIYFERAKLLKSFDQPPSAKDFK